MLILSRFVVAEAFAGPEPGSAERCRLFGTYQSEEVATFCRVPLKHRMADEVGLSLFWHIVL